MVLNFWRDVAIVILAIQLFVMLVIPLAISFFFVKGVNAGKSKLAVLFQKGQHYSGLVSRKTNQASERVAEPVVRVRSQTDRVVMVLNRLWDTDGNTNKNSGRNTDWKANDE